MKHLILTILISFLAGSVAFSQEIPASEHKNDSSTGHMHQGKRKYPTKEELQSQKIAFFTQELSLTPEEAQKFWPVYNESSKKLHQARRLINASLKELNNAIKGENTANDSQIKSLMDNYFKACNEEIKIQSELFEDLTKVLPVEKAAKTFSLEERFRVMLIKQLRR
jgi:Spy/CpxP family protein refolding chaperone